MSQDQLRPEGELREQHANWAERHARLVRGPAPAERPQRPRPVSPFVREAMERRAEADQARAEAEARRRRLAALPPPKAPDWKVIAYRVAKKHGVTFADLIGPRRSNWIARARHEAVFQVYIETSLSTTEIARRFGGRDHTTAINSMQWMCKHTAGAKEQLAAAKKWRAGATARLAERACQLRDEGKTPGEIFNMLPISEVALWKALACPREQMREAANG